MKAITTLLLTFLLIASILTSGCSTNDTSEEPVAVDELIVTFEPESCVYDGPKVIKQGEIKITYDNLTENVVNDRVFLIPEDKTWQDIVDNFREGNRNVDIPYWVIFQSGRPLLDDTRLKVYSRIYNLEPGTYGLACMEILETGAWVNWLASPIEVK